MNTSTLFDKMTFSSLISVLTLAIISRDVNCKKGTEIEFIKDFISDDVSKSITLIAFLCWNSVEKYALYSKLSENNIIASVYNTDTANVKHYQSAENILYLFDLECDNSMNIISTANDKNLFVAPYKWLILTKTENYNNTNIEFFSMYNFSVDSNIILAQRTGSNQYDLMEIYKHSKLSETLQKNHITYWTLGKGFNNFQPRFLTALRRNLNGTTLKATIVVLYNDTFNHLTDYRFNHIDTITKVNYIFTNHLIDFVNGTKVFEYVNTWGYLNKEDNMYTGMIGTLQRDQAEIGGTSLFMTADRVAIIEYIAMTTPTRAKFVFRQPPLSYVTNVFTLPFSGDVWLSSLGLCIIASILLYIAVSVEWRTHSQSDNTNILLPSFMESVMLTIGAVAQQGATSEPRSGAGRMVMILTFIALMFLYVSYSANIVALLQSSATNIRTLEDLLNSRLKLGVEDIVYNHYYFETATEPIRKAIYERKVAPKGQKPNFMKIDDGISRVRQGFFAFHGELGSVYKLVGDTFYESEKCGMQEIQYLQVVEPYFAIKKNSSYKEIFKIGLRKIQESGVQSRELQRLYTKKPACHSSGGNFVSVGLIDSYPAFLVLGSGMGLSLLLFFTEKIVDKRMNR